MVSAGLTIRGLKMVYVMLCMFLRCFILLCTVEIIRLSTLVFTRITSTSGSGYKSCYLETLNRWDTMHTHLPTILKHIISMARLLCLHEEHSHHNGRLYKPQCSISSIHRNLNLVLDHLSDKMGKLCKYSGCDHRD